MSSRGQGGEEAGPVSQYQAHAVLLLAVQPVPNKEGRVKFTLKIVQNYYKY